jgi:sugar lactone lactonase YvrE
MRSSGGEVMAEIACVAHTQDILGEVPRWHPIERVLYWIDAFKPAIHRLDPVSAALESWTPPEKLGSFAPRVGRGLLIAGRGASLTTIRQAEGSIALSIPRPAARSTSSMTAAATGAGDFGSAP